MPEIMIHTELWSELGEVFWKTVLIPNKAIINGAVDKNDNPITAYMNRPLQRREYSIRINAEQHTVDYISKYLEERRKLLDVLVPQVLLVPHYENDDSSYHFEFNSYSVEQMNDTIEFIRYTMRRLFYVDIFKGDNN